MFYISTPITSEGLTPNSVRIEHRWRLLRRLAWRHKLSLAFFSTLSILASLLLLCLLLLSPTNTDNSIRGAERFLRLSKISDFAQAAGERVDSVIDAKKFQHWQGGPLDARDKNELEWNYLLKEKLIPLVGHQDWLKKVKKGSKQYYNSLAVVAGYDDDHMHGVLGVRENRTNVWVPRAMPPPISEYPGGKEEALKNGGFYLALSDALPLSRKVPDLRDHICKDLDYNITSLGDASIVIIFFNEPLSTLLRTVHSVLNYTPAPILREIILVDDHSDSNENYPGGPLYKHLQYLPKVKLMRLAERKGIVHARIAGARAAQGSVLVTLDSHVEVSPGWLEPQLDRIRQNSKAIVFPQILSMTHDTLELKVHSGIGCWLTFRWVVVEQAMLTGKVTSPEAKASPSMAGGLFAVDRAWFWELGGYDEDFIAWGAENVEMAFRAWMCGGRVECIPCSQTYHIYRKGGTGYGNPPGALWRNRKRTARIWMDEYYQLASPMIDLSAHRGHYKEPTDEELSRMLQLKERLQCKSFQWYLQNVDPQHDIQDLDDTISLGRIRMGDECIDTEGSRSVGHRVIVYTCHSPQNYSATQGFLVSRGDNRIRLMANDKRCLGLSSDLIMSVEQCNDISKSAYWKIEEEQDRDTYRIMWTKQKSKCLSIGSSRDNRRIPILVPCTSEESMLEWNLDSFVRASNFTLPRILKKQEGRLRQRQNFD